MKKIVRYTLLCGLALILSACGKTPQEGEAVSKMKGVFYTSVVDADNASLQLLPGKAKTVDVQVRALEGAVSDITLWASLKVDPDGVAAYSASHGGAVEMLPSSAYELVRNEVMIAKYNANSTSGKVRIVANGLQDNVQYVLPLTIDKMEGTDNWALAENPVAYIAVIQTNIGPEGGDGSMEYPFELSTPKDLEEMSKKLSKEEKVYFKMMNDIDMSGIVWTPLNYQSPYDNAIDFDGAGHTISNFFCDFSSYPSFFGVLNGYCHDVTFKDAVIECNADSGCGILGGYAGTGDVHADVARVHVHGKVTLNGNKTGVGGMFGTLGNCSIVASSADCEVTSGKNFVGGLFGYAKGSEAGTVTEVSDCWTSGTVTGNQRVGGIGGGTDKSGYNVRITNCYSLSAVKAVYGFGGIGGIFNLDSSSGATTNLPNNVIEKCIAWNESVKANTVTPGDKAHYSAGAVVGFTATQNYLTDCVRKPDFVFEDYSDLFGLYDQENASPAAPLYVMEVPDAPYNFPYHGKAAAAGKTLSQVAKDLGWSTAIWDFSGDVPKIKPDAQAGPVPDVTGEGQLPGFDENDIN